MTDSTPNIIFIVTDQERHFSSWPTGYELPGRQRLQDLGVTFTNHTITSNVCTPSRSTIYTGQHIQRTTVFDNVNFPWSNDLPTDMPTIGHRMRDLGYYSAYLGKWHLSEALDTTDVYAGANPEFGDILDEYGFSDFVGPGDVIGMTQGGYRSDEMIGAAARRWLRVRGQDLAAEDTPWFLAVNLVNPHDAMMFDTDLPGSEPVQTAGPTMVPVAPAPPSALYAATWDLPLPATRHEAWDAPGRPAAHREYQEARRFLTGLIPDEDDRWQRFQDYYLNCIRDNDRQIAALLAELDDQGFLDDAVVIQTSDHGELGGAHQMSGKGATAYREQNNVPLIIKHPNGAAGATCDSLTSHLDLVPTILGCTGLDSVDAGDLPGHDITPVLSGGATGLHDVRDAALYNYNMFTLMDADFLEVVATAKVTGVQPETPPQFDFTKRGAIRSVFDGRYKFSRYFSPLEHHRPETLEDLTARNDLELFDLQSDPDEANNLATDPAGAADTILEMNALLNRLIDEEVGVDDGSFLPTGNQKPWEVERWDV